MRNPILLAAVSIAVALMAGREYVAYAARGGGGGRGGVVGARTESGGGSFERPAARSAPERSSGGESFGARLPSRSAYSEPRQPSARGFAPEEEREPRTSIPTFTDRPIRPAEPNAALVDERRSGRAAENGFINLPEGTGAGVGRPQPLALQRENGARADTATGTRLSRGLGTTANSRANLAMMPAVQQHLQRNGQTLPAWSASRDQGFDRLHQQNAPRLAAFQNNREATWSRLQAGSSAHARSARENGADAQGYGRELSGYRNNRGHEVRDRVRDGADDLFTSDWRRNRGYNSWYGDYSPWWLWDQVSWDGLAAFDGYGGGEPIDYDYGANVVDSGDDVYVNGQDWGSEADYSQQADQLANPPDDEEEPGPPQTAGQSAQWQPLGVFALVQEEKGDAVMFFQLALNKNGRIAGSFANMLTDGSAIVTGSLDKKTQRAAWHVGDKTNTVYEAGLVNLTQEVAPVLIHFQARATQTWLLVHMPSPDLPTAPTPVKASAQR